LGENRLAWMKMNLTQNIFEEGKKPENPLWSKDDLVETLMCSGKNYL
jgi:hypothetical protein